MIHVLGFDPSTELRSSWAHLTVDGETRRLLAGGTYATHGPDDIERLLQGFVATTCGAANAAVAPTAIVAVEVPNPWAGVDRKRTKALMDCATTAGWVHGLARGIGLRVVVLAPEAWRQQIVGSRRCDDLTIQRALGALVPGASGSNNHVRDAAGVALAAALRVQHEPRVLLQPRVAVPVPPNRRVR